jgi:hypothetical protein
MKHPKPVLLSTGDLPTLGNYRLMCVAAFGEDSRAVAYLDRKIASEPGGAEELVLADETQMVWMLGALHLQGLEAADD